MNFAQTVKDEIYAKQIRSELVQFRLAGVFFVAKAAGVVVTTSGELADFICENTKAEIENLGGKFLCEIHEDNTPALTGLDSAQLKEFACGVFLAGARSTISLESERRGSGYHIEFVFERAENAREFCEMLASFEILPKLTERSGKNIIYIKSSDCICNLLALMGTTRSLLALSNEIAVRELRNTSNRRVNCDTYNINKQIEAAAQQVEIILKMQSDGRLLGLNEKLREVAQARLNSPEATLDELARQLGLTKSCVVHRLRKLTETV